MDMKNKSPFSIIKSKYITEKSNVLSSLCQLESNACLKKFDKPKYVFIVDSEANKKEIAWAIEKIYEEKKVKVTAVNVINVIGKMRKVRGHTGRSKNFKKAIVTLSKGDSLDEQL